MLEVGPIRRHVSKSQPDIVINGKFLGANLNGVHRSAAQFARRLTENAQGIANVRLFVPNSLPAEVGAELPAPELVRGRFGTGQGWEMLSLPQAARGALLVNFCNLAPLLHGNSIVMIHDAQTYLYPKDYSGRQAMAYRALLPWIGRRARRVLTVSEFSRSTLAAHGIADENKIDVVPNGTDHILDVPPDARILDRHGLQRHGFVLVLGSAKEYKNIRRVFAALADGGPRLVVAGGPDRDAYLSRGWNPPDSAVFTGFVTDAELRALYQNATLFAFPSLTEGFGLPAVEAMHCGCPVIVAAAGAMPEICGGAALQVDPTDTAAWRKAIKEITQSAQLADDLRQRGEAQARAYSWQRAGQRLWSVLEPLLD